MSGLVWHVHRKTALSTSDQVLPSGPRAARLSAPRSERGRGREKRPLEGGKGRRWQGTAEARPCRRSLSPRSGRGGEAATARPGFHAQEAPESIPSTATLCGQGAKALVAASQPSNDPLGRVIRPLSLKLLSVKWQCLVLCQAPGRDPEQVPCGRLWRQARVTGQSPAESI